ncbi:SAM-dependent methyltransferase [Gordoniibacillus kamchatkensis]|uniref:SAM-dependent methyltransferase n=1 Tax=Gordoniibacillus kamchatkensis TaxID=1590651 RepID=A0ABR5AL92_9BACL|nr:class I SAM-dependent methyltransferase [Paenibacillus sp. VKM B-2647]KIL41794.1 SAM-dependent methyltransferase [Paenibacillus sp. VKM B-2647]
MIKLSKRLQQIADLVPNGARLADIGSDHALLPVHLAERGMIAFAVAGEVNEGPLRAASKQVCEAGLTERIDVRLGDGLAVIRPGEVDVITIAGMGGALIVSILSAGLPKLEGVRTLILQPNVGEEAVRRWLVDHGWFLAKEHILEEDGKIYEILTAMRVPNAEKANVELYAPRQLAPSVTASPDRLLQMGPYLLEQASDTFIHKWLLELEKMERICAQLALSEAEASRRKEAELREYIAETEDILTCLQKAKR